MIGPQLGVGFWVDRFILGAGFGAMAVFCDKSPCGKDPQKNDNSSHTSAVHASAAYWVADLPNHWATFLVGLRYSYLPITLDTPEGDRHLSVHGAQATFTWEFGGLGRAAVTHQERTSLFRLTVPVGALIDPGDNRAAFTVGMSLGYLLPF